MNSRLRQYIRETTDSFSGISKARKDRLRSIRTYIQKKRDSGRQADLVFICTHNSRRSQLAQIWATAFTYYYGVDGLRFYSGGTEETAFNPRAVEAVKRAGFNVEQTNGENPRYRLHVGNNVDSILCFSKIFDHSHNPQEKFAAVMTCTDADEKCPFISGAERRFSLPYRDPKVSDDTPRETETYDRRCRQIAEEMAFLIMGALPQK